MLVLSSYYKLKDTFRYPILPLTLLRLTSVNYRSQKNPVEKSKNPFPHPSLNLSQSLKVSQNLSLKKTPLALIIFPQAPSLKVLILKLSIPQKSNKLSQTLSSLTSKSMKLLTRKKTTSKNPIRHLTLKISRKLKSKKKWTIYQVSFRVKRWPQQKFRLP